MNDKHTKTARLNLRLPENIKAMLDELAASEMRSVTSWIEVTVCREHARLIESRQRRAGGSDG